jgi:hypothetical protein|tara:strand:+ start:806 stop:1045 length:240 start_codon:yes stop_codon:yes gene_type:complete
MKHDDDTLDMLQMALGALKPDPPEPGDLVMHTNDPDVLGIVLHTHSPGDWHKAEVQWEDDDSPEVLLSAFLKVISRADN